jgi:hypothetical protein
MAKTRSPPTRSARLRVVLSITHDQAAYLVPGTSTGTVPVVWAKGTIIGQQVTPTIDFVSIRDCKNILEFRFSPRPVILSLVETTPNSTGNGRCAVMERCNASFGQRTMDGRSVIGQNLSTGTGSCGSYKILPNG